MGFEQLNYNRYDLIQVELEILREVIKLHQMLKKNKNIPGLKSSNIHKIIQEYAKAH